MTKITPFDAADYLDTPEAVAEFIIAALETDDPAYIAHAIGTCARAKGMSRIAEETGLAREALYTALSERGNPGFATVLKVLKALGIKLTARAA
jgi:probable addiction module antidote protein